MSLLIARLIVDFGLLILIWITQLITYPSFYYISDQEMKVWHLQYTRLISYFVAPLLFCQSLIAGMQLLEKPNWYSIGSILIIAFLFIHTFFFAVPIHNDIAMGKDLKACTKRLIRINWKRTICWSLLFIMSLTHLLLA